MSNQANQQTTSQSHRGTLTSGTLSHSSSPRLTNQNALIGTPDGTDDLDVPAIPIKETAAKASRFKKQGSGVRAARFTKENYHGN